MSFFSPMTSLFLSRSISRIDRCNSFWFFLSCSSPHENSIMNISNRCAHAYPLVFLFYQTSIPSFSSNLKINTTWYTQHEKIPIKTELEIFLKTTTTLSTPFCVVKISDTMNVLQPVIPILYFVNIPGFHSPVFWHLLGCGPPRNIYGSLDKIVYFWSLRSPILFF